MTGIGLGRRALAAVVSAIVVAAGSPSESRAVTVPSPPLNLVAAAGDGFALLRWDPPLDDGGAPITGYGIGNYADGTLYFFGEVFPTANELRLDETLYVLNTLEVAFTLRACNEAGCGGDSEPRPGDLGRRHHLDEGAGTEHRAEGLPAPGRLMGQRPPVSRRPARVPPRDRQPDDGGLPRDPRLALGEAPGPDGASRRRAQRLPGERASRRPARPWASDSGGTPRRPRRGPPPRCRPRRSWRSPARRLPGSTGRAAE